MYQSIDSLFQRLGYSSPRNIQHPTVGPLDLCFFPNGKICVASQGLTVPSKRVRTSQPQAGIVSRRQRQDWSWFLNWYKTSNIMIHTNHVCIHVCIFFWDLPIFLLQTKPSKYFKTKARFQRHVILLHLQFKHYVKNSHRPLASQF